MWHILDMSHYNLSRRVKNICKCTCIKGWQRCLGNLHSLHDLYLCINVGCTLHVSQAAPLKHCMSSRLQLSTMSDHQAWGFPNLVATNQLGCTPILYVSLAPGCACTDVCTSVCSSPSSVTSLGCRVKWCNAWWTGICIIFHHQIMMCDEQTHLRLHRSYTHISAVELEQSAEEDPCRPSSVFVNSLN